MKQKQVIILIILLISCVLSKRTKAKDNENSPIKHVIVLGMENQSYDHLLGYMEAPYGELNEKTYCNAYLGKKYCTRPFAKFQSSPDPPHDFISVNESIFGTKEFPAGNNMEPTMSWFVKEYVEKKNGNPQDYMDCYVPDQLPIITTLAREFKLTDRWFSPIPTNTDPNKYFYHCATSLGNTGNCSGWYCSGYPMVTKTIYESLEEEGYTWSLHWMDWSEAFAIYPFNRKFDNIIYDEDMSIFFDKLKNGNLDNYTFLTPRIHWETIPDGETKEENVRKAPNTQHPSEDIRSGEILMKQVYEHLRNSQYWENTLLLVTYDEAGGFYDHVVPPMDAVNPSPDQSSWPNSFEWERYGVRIPGIVISPWIQKGIDSKTYDHASVPKTVKEIFNLKADYLSERDKAANSFFTKDEILEKPRDDCPMTLPPVPSFKDIPITYTDEIQFGGTMKTQTYLLGTMMLKDNLLSEHRYKQILQMLETNNQAKEFLKEALELLGYIKPTNKQFKYLSRDVRYNLL